nr:LysM peptidoglycan-binding domain-containing protein [Eubacterium sp.]
MEIYVVKEGDTVDAIAQAFAVSPENIIENNQLTVPYPLAVGQALLIGEPEPGSERVRDAGGYAYTYISRWVLRQTLPFLERLFVFSYGFTEEGELLLPPQDDMWMIEMCQEFDTMPILTLTPFGTDGRFNNNLIHQIVTDATARERLLTELVQIMTEKGYGGIDIDFEFILAEDRDLFTAFVAQTAEIMHDNGFVVSVALAPKTSADQKGLLYEGKDYGALGKVADAVLLMTYEWGYKYGPPMAVAPLNSVRRVLDYAVTEIPPMKINLGIPNYGYDWPLPYERGRTVARTIGNVEAVQIAIRYGAEIFFDEKSQSPYFEYVDEDGADHVVWFEDVRSLAEKYSLITEYGLKGIGVWQIMRWYRAMWLLNEQS